VRSSFAEKISRRRLLTVGFCLVCAVALLASCAGGPAPTDIVATPSDAGLADRLHDQLVQAQSEGRDRAALQLGFELIDRHRDYSQLDGSVLLAARSAERLGDTDAALRLTNEIIVLRPDAPLVSELLSLRTDLALAAGDTALAADSVLRLHSRAADGGAREAAADRLADLAVGLGADDLDQLLRDHPESGLRPYLFYLHLHHLIAEGRREEAPASIAALRRESPASDWLSQAEMLLGEPGYVMAESLPLRPTAGGVDPSRLGVLCPLTGRYMVLGNAFYDGARLAVEQTNNTGWRQYSLSVRDTGGDPVSAALAVRRMAAQERPVAMIGGLLSGTTVAAAVVADGFGIPLISPTATNDRIWEIGPAVFQTNHTGMYEARLLARTAIGVLLKQRIAVLHPDTPEGVRSYEVFAEEVLALGGEIVAAEALGVGLTDFRDPLDRIKTARPEIIYIPASVDLMMLLGPQLDFYRSGALVMGPSSWNTPRLAREVGSILERSIFPSDTALFPAEWAEAFAEGWNSEHLPEEATAIALRAFNATRLVLRVLAEEEIRSREDLSRSLSNRIAARRETEVDPNALGPALRIWSRGGVEPFPVELFAGSFAAGDAESAEQDAEDTAPGAESAEPALEAGDTVADESAGIAG